MPLALARSLQSGILASGRRQYSQWEQGEDMEVLDTQDASEATRMARTLVEDVDTGESTARGVQQPGATHRDMELSHITVASPL